MRHCILSSPIRYPGSHGSFKALRPRLCTRRVGYPGVREQWHLEPSQSIAPSSVLRYSDDTPYQDTLLPVAMPGAPSSVLAPSRNALCYW